MTASSPDLDTLRDEWPSFGFAVYAYAPGAPVTAECTIRDETVAVQGATAAQALARLAAMLRPDTSQSLVLFDLPEWSAPPAPSAAPEPTPADAPDIFG